MSLALRPRSISRLVYGAYAEPSPPVQRAATLQAASSFVSCGSIAPACTRRGRRRTCCDGGFNNSSVNKNRRRSAPSYLSMDLQSDGPPFSSATSLNICDATAPRRPHVRMDQNIRRASQVCKWQPENSCH